MKSLCLIKIRVKDSYKIGHKLWKHLSRDEKRIYYSRASKDRRRFRIAIRSYKELERKFSEPCIPRTPIEIYISNFEISNEHETLKRWNALTEIEKEEYKKLSRNYIISPNK